MYLWRNSWMFRLWTIFFTDHFNKRSGSRSQYPVFMINQIDGTLQQFGAKIKTQKVSEFFIIFCSNFTDNRYTQTMTDSLFDAFGRRQFCQNMKLLIVEADALKISIGFFARSASFLAENKGKIAKLADWKIPLVDLISRGIWCDQNQLILQQRFKNTFGIRDLHTGKS